LRAGYCLIMVDTACSDVLFRNGFDP